MASHRDFELPSRLAAIHAIENLDPSVEGAADWFADALLSETREYGIEESAQWMEDPHLYRDAEDVFEELRARYGDRAYEAAVWAWNLSQSPEYIDADRKETYRAWTEAELEAEAEALRAYGWSDSAIARLQSFRKLKEN